MKKMTMLVVAALVLLCAVNQAPAQQAPALQEAILGALTLPNGRNTVAHCRNLPGGCESLAAQLADSFTRHAYAEGPDAWLLAAVAWKESGFRQAAEGPGGELTVMQLNPRGRAFAEVMGSGTCRQIRNHQCLDTSIRVAARMLNSAIRRCGEDAGLYAYNSGHCLTESSYAHRVMEYRTRLLALAP